MFTPPPLDQKSESFPIFADFPPAMSPPPLEDFSPDKEFSPPPMDNFSPGKDFSPPPFEDFSPVKDDDFEIGGYNGTLDLEEDDTKFQKILQLQPREILEMKKESEQQTNFMEQRTIKQENLVNNHAQEDTNQKVETVASLPPEPESTFDLEDPAPKDQSLPVPEDQETLEISEKAAPLNTTTSQPVECPIDSSNGESNDPSKDFDQNEIVAERNISSNLVSNDVKPMETSCENACEQFNINGESDKNASCESLDFVPSEKLNIDSECSNNNNEELSDIENNFISHESGIKQHSVTAVDEINVKNNVESKDAEPNVDKIIKSEDVNSNHIPELKDDSDDVNWGDDAFSIENQGKIDSVENTGKTDFFADFDGGSEKTTANDSWGNFEEELTPGKDEISDADDDDDFGDFDSAEPTTVVNTDLQLQNVIIKIGAGLQEQIASVFSLPDELADSNQSAVNKLTDTVEKDEEVWKQVEDPASTPGLEFTWADSCLYSILLNTLNIDTRIMLDGENWKNSIQRNHKSASTSSSNYTGGILQPTTVDILKPTPVQSTPSTETEEISSSSSQPASLTSVPSFKVNQDNCLPSNQVDLHSPDFDWSLPDQPESDVKGDGPDLTKSTQSWLSPLTPASTIPSSTSTSLNSNQIGGLSGTPGLARVSSPCTSTGATQILDAFPLLNFMNSHVLIQPTRSPFSKRRTK